MIKPCPFCGGGSHIEKLGWNGYRVARQCNDCNALGPAAKIDDLANELWNRREVEQNAAKSTSGQDTWRA